MTITITWKQVIKAILLITSVLVVLKICDKYINNKIIYYISAYDEYKSNAGMVEKGDGEPGKLDHSKDDIHS